ncbi:MAG TPA: sigma-70 family RNA polymerase sigma factor [Candidatus Saccharimonadales bacterium]
MTRKFGELTPVTAAAESGIGLEQNEMRLAFLGRTSLEQGFDWDMATLTTSQAEECFDHLDFLHQHARSNVSRLFRASRKIAGTREILEAVRSGMTPEEIYQAMEFKSKTSYTNTLRGIQRVLRVALTDYCELNEFEAPTKNGHIQTLVDGGIIYRDAAIGVHFGLYDEAQRTIQAFNTDQKWLKKIATKSAPILWVTYGPNDPVAGRLATHGRTEHRTLRPKPVQQKPKEPRPDTSTPKITIPEIEDREPLLKADEEVELAKIIEVGQFAKKLLAGIKADAHSPDQLSPELQEIVDRKDFTLKELEELVKDGDRAFMQFLLANTGLVRFWIIRSIPRFVSARISHDEVAINDMFADIVSDDKMGLWHAVEKFDFTRGIKFSTYASGWIKKSVTQCILDRLQVKATKEDYDDVMDFVRKNDFISLQDESGHDDDDPTINEAWVAAPPYSEVVADGLGPAALRYLNELLSVLDPIERRVLKSVYENNESFRKAGESLHMSRHRVKRIYDTAMLKLTTQQENPEEAEDLEAV